MRIEVILKPQSINISRFWCCWASQALIAEWFGLVVWKRIPNHPNHQPSVGDPFERDRPWSVIEGESLENFPKIVFSFSKDITVHLGNCRYRSYRIQLGPCPFRFILAHALLLPISPATWLFCWDYSKQFTHVFSTILRFNSMSHPSVLSIVLLRLFSKQHLLNVNAEFWANVKSR